MLSRISGLKRLARISRGLASIPTNDKHYTRVNETYHSAWFYDKGSEYEDWQLELVASTFVGLGQHAELADIGGGTGRFSHLLFTKLQLKKEVLCVDPFKEMLTLAKQQPGVSTLQQDAVSFASTAESNSFDGFLLKEVVHHIPNSSLDALFRGLFQCARPGAVCTVVTRPKYETNYPFMAKAKQVWIENQEDSSVYASAIKRAGFGDCKAELHPFKVKMPMEQWLGMIRNRMWSTFSESNFTAAELEDGIREIRETYHPDSAGDIEFEERLSIISARKPAAA